MSYDLKIHLDSPHRRPYGGPRGPVLGHSERISGKVVLALKSDENVDAIIIELKGKVRTQHGHGDNRHTYEKTIFLLEQKLFNGPYKMRATTHEYPFSFDFPESFSLSGGEVEVHYHLTARVPRKFVDWEDKINLNFSPWRTELDVREESEKAIPTTCEPAHREYRLTQEGVPRPLTKSEAFKESFRTKSKPETKTVNFTLAAIAPTQIVIGKPYQLEIMVTSPNAEELGIVPEFRLKSYELNLKEKTDLRVPGVFMDHQTCLESHLPLTSSSKIDTVLPVNEMTKFNAMFPTHGAFPPPNFTSFAIRRRYVLELKAEVECFGERERYKIQWASVTLHPSRMEPGVEEAMRSIEAGTATLDVGMSERAVDVLPVYQPADGQDTLPRYEKHVEGSVLGL